jgi:hypothetical protein
MTSVYPPDCFMVYWALGTKSLSTAFASRQFFIGSRTVGRLLPARPA